MRLHWIPFLAVIILGFVIDAVVMRRAYRSHNRMCKCLGVLNSVVSVLALAGVIGSLSHAAGTKQEFVGHMATSARWLLFYFVVNVPKWLWGIFYGIGSIRGMSENVSFILKRAGAAFAVVSLVSMLYGTFVTPYSLQVNEVSLAFKSLPAGFDGYRIVHISDAHLGTYGGDTAFVSQCVDAINALNPDVVCFTGDLVSMTAEEAKPFGPVLARLRARDGVYSILGNHDYAEYMRILTDEQKKQDVEELCRLQCAAGWTMLHNGNAVIKHGNDSIAVVGTENYGDFPFPVYGDYGKASAGLDGVFKVHLQHNPYMWRKALVGKADAPLTLSGHTHAMQFVVNLMGNRWSPSSWRYNEWGGLYAEGNQMLYVNTGLGMVGPPLRIGVAPEITLITLKKK